ncbi:thiamine phosphate synthase [Pedobacter sp. AW31-3R]|uniref:thiamine phosphate synthase n=1 Tax=Pedobacter sp. AW31-3R TaxID=3445781 RepID=UPI003F9F24A5
MIDKIQIDRLHYISRSAEDGSHLTSIERVLHGGASWVQLRIKEQPEAEVLRIAKQAVDLCQQYKAKLIINDYPKIALQSGAYGVHLGLDDMPIPEARALLGKAKCIGGTANTFNDILRRAEEGADYIGLGPYRFTQTKKNLSPILGIAGYQEIMEQMKQAGITIPVIAIGGIEPEDLPLLLDTGIHGVAVSGALDARNEQSKRIEAFYQQLTTSLIVPQ